MGIDTVRISRRHALTATTLAAAGAGLATPFSPIRPTAAAAPLHGPSVPTYHRVRLGAFEVTTLFDGAVVLDGPHPIFGQNVAVEELQALAEENFLPPTRFEIGFTPVVVNTGVEVVLFDAGNGAGRRPTAGRLAGLLEIAGFSADQIDVVVLTHFHPDHIGGLMENGAPLFANARYVATAAEFDFWSDDDRLSGPTERVARLTRTNVVPVADRMSFVEPGASLVSGITAIAAFGHTPGHTVYHLESEGQRLMITADTSNHYVVSLQRPDWHVRFDMDKETAATARKEVFGMIAADRIPFTGYHMPFPSIGYVEPHGPGFRFVPASYQFNV